MAYITTVLLMAVMLSGCSSGPGREHPAVLVAAAADLTKVSQPLGRAFERSTGIRVTFGFGSSGQLEQQIRQGASFDIYAPAARSYCEAIERDGFADGVDKPYALGRLVAWSKSLQLGSLDQLKEARIQRIAIANPGYAPYGAAAQQALQKAGLWQAVQPKIVYAENVAHALQMAETGNTEVALVALALVRGNDGSVLAVDPSLYSPIEQAAVVLKGSQNKQAAKSFLDFLLAPEAQEIFKEYGFGHL